MENRVLPEFKSEAEEAKWWFENQDELDEEFARAASDGVLGRGTVARHGGIPPTPIRLDPMGSSLTEEQSGKRG